ncbi:hypothetical protein [Frigoriflavimonas asaccharolytica]|uniref:Uncharacterized protein n=1 Tax=Frigoriflavimonas asaccharolytica TaxID=2735899 RepID=A0A8J8K8D4_9FLAO|nr:hypothetical protein [Frigoriflavimonas asaccharolytica]NRS91832.1 hypothetical protein [Frigoriflavimonas asaccharolytica]
MIGKNLLAVIILFLLINCATYKVKEIHFKSETIELNATLDKIDSTENDYVYFIKNDTIKAYFSKEKICQSYFKKKLDTGKTYKFIVKTDANLTYRYKTLGDTLLYIEGEFFGEEEPRLILIDCLNICGKTIDEN